MEIIREKLGVWSASVLVKGLKMNVMKTILMVGGGVVSELDAWPSEVSSKPGQLD